MKKEAGLLWNRIPKTVWSSQSSVRCTRNNTPLAGEAPICNGTLFQDFGYTASTPASRAVLNVTYVAPTDSDNATKELFAEIAAI